MEAIDKVLFARQLSIPDGRPLYAYRIAIHEFENLHTSLRHELADRQQSDRLPAALFCLVAAEYLARGDGSDWWTWQPIKAFVGFEGSDADVRDAVRRGLAYWKRPLVIGGTGRQFLGTLVCEGGLPLKELGRCGGGELRAYTAGATVDWDFGAWSFDHYLVRLGAAGVKVVLVIPADVLDDMPWDQAAALRARAEAAGVRLHVGPRGGVRQAAGWLLAEVGGPARSVRWAVTGPQLAAPGDRWGQVGASAEGSSSCVRIVQAQPLAALELGLATPAQLDKARPGTFVEVMIVRQLDGEHPQVGAKFWSTLSSAVVGLAARLEGETQLIRVTYEDRYVASPMNAATVHRVLTHLSSLSGGIGKDTAVELRTTGSNGNSMERRIWDDWRSSVDQNAVLNELFADLGRANVQVLRRHEASHFRQLLLEWRDGRQLLVRLDHGLSFLRSMAHIQHRFGDPPTRQADSIRKLSFVARQQAGSIVPIYVQGP